MSATRLVALLVTALVALCASAVRAPASFAAAPALDVQTVFPDVVTPGKGVLVSIAALNVGDAPLSGNLNLRLTVPDGVKVAPLQGGLHHSEPTCESSGQVEECTVDTTGIAVGTELRYQLRTFVEPQATGVLTGQIELSGAGTAGVITRPITMTVGPPVPFALKSLGVDLSEGAGFPAAQAASVPSQLLTHVAFLSEAAENLNAPVGAAFVTTPAESFKDVVVHAPPGFVGNPTATPVRCTPSQLATNLFGMTIPSCPLASQIGFVKMADGAFEPLYNIQPPRGVPAEFGLAFKSIVITLLAKLRPSDHGIDIVTSDTPSAIPIPQFEVTLWGVPGDPQHNPFRGGRCLNGDEGLDPNLGTCAIEVPSVPFLRMPTSCTGEALPWSIDANSYQHPEAYVHGSTTTPAVEGCSSIPFEPSFTLAPSVLAPNTPSGLDATLALPQSNSPTGLAQSDLRTATVTLPTGMTLNPAAANGLQGCTDEQLNLGQEGAASCPEASAIGTVTLTTPLLDHPLTGRIFQRTQNSSDPASGQLFRIALEIRSDQDGIDIKLPGQVKVNPVTGQVTTVFEDQPQLPFSSLYLHFKGGPRAMLVTPSKCGTYTTRASFTGWNGKVVESDSSFTINQGCGAAPFTPGIDAGTTNPVAGAFAPLSLRFTRPDGDASLGTLSSLSLPPGLLADVASVPVRCTEAQARAAACPAASHVGTVTVGAGAGSPFYDSGDVYLMGQFGSGRFAGDPFGLAVVVHALAGPFDLGYVVNLTGVQVRDDGSIYSQTEPFPTMLKGVPLRLQDVRISLDRPGFTLNPTNCNAMSATGTMLSEENIAAPLSNRFQVGECSALRFAPKFSATTRGDGEFRRNGASLDVKISAPNQGPNVPFGKREANVRKVEVALPKVLPSRLTTLQKACTEAQFAANPAGCPHESLVGTARAVTPILAHPLEGPAYLVSHGGEAFPDLVLVLQGEGIVMDVTGHTQIKKGITYSRFETVPDAPISSFELRLPEGRYSILAATTTLCGHVSGNSRLSMPTTITAQDGAVVRQSTKIAVTGCRKAHSSRARSPRRSKRR